MHRDLGHLFEAVGRLIDGADGVQSLQEHRLEALAVRRWHARRVAVPPECRAAARLAAVRHLAAPIVLADIRAATDGPLVLTKGPEMAVRYPQPADRGFGDLDLLVPHADAVQADLLAAGYEPLSEPWVFAGLHHHPPLRPPGAPLLVEVHRTPNWPPRLPAPPLEEIIAAAGPSATGIPGILAPAPAHHAVMLAAHAWRHSPLGRVRELLDIAVLQAECDAADTAAVARAWGVQRLWQTTSRALDALFAGDPWPWCVRPFAGSCAGLRGRTVAETHVEKWTAPFGVLAPHAALAASTQEMLRDLRPLGGEGWGTKLRRTRRALRDARLPERVHSDEALNDRSSKGDP